MRKLAILSAVAAFAAFGWASDADAEDDPIVGPLNAACNFQANPSGTVDDVYRVSWSDLSGQDADRYGVTLQCGDSGRHRATAGTDGTQVDIPVPDMNGWRSLDDGEACIAWVKALYEQGEHNGGNVVEHPPCDNINDQ